MSSGFVASAVVLLLLGVRCALARRAGPRECAAAALLAALCAAGFLCIGHPRGGEALRAHSPWGWLTAVAGGLAWPDMKAPAACVVLQLPILFLALRRIRERRIEGSEAVLFALGAWAWVQVAAIAFARANHGLISSPRYMDVYAVGAAVNVLAMAILLGRGPALRARLLAALWVSVFRRAGRWDINHAAFSDYLDKFPAAKAAERSNVRLYLATGDASVLRNATPGEIPYPDPEWLKVFLDSPAIREVLPPGIRPSLPLAPEAHSGGFAAAPLAQLQAGASGRVWVARGGPARFVSEPLPSRVLPFLHFSVAGSPDLSASSLHLESEGAVVPAPDRRLLGEEWIPFDLAVPREPTVRIVVDGPPGDHWLAFSGPVEVGRGTWANHWLLRRSGFLAAAAALLLAAALAALLSRLGPWP